MSDEFDDDIIAQRAADISTADKSTWFRVDASMSREEIIAKFMGVDVALITPGMTDAQIVAVVEQFRKPHH